jgi:hypothetical protein
MVYSRLIGQTAHNTANNDAPSFEMDYSYRSITFGARELIVYSAKSNGVVCRDVVRNCPKPIKGCNYKAVKK